jgi:sugar (pentulose or hexulose) kinase
VAAEILLTVDLGTTNCKAQAFTLDGLTVASETTAYATANPREGWYEQRVADWREAIVSSLRPVVEALGPERDAVAGLALSAWGPGLVLLGSDLAPLNERSPTWQDTRSRAHGERLLAEAGPDWIGGGMPLTGFPAKLAWAIEAWPEFASSAAYAVGVKDYLLWWLTGSLATEPSSGPYGAGWSASAFGTIGWDVDRLPSVVASTAVLGTLLPDRAAELGLGAGIPVVAGLNDGAAATLGVGAHTEGDVVVSLGTNGVLRYLTAAPPTAETCLASSLFRYPLLGDIWVGGGFVLSGGSALAWLADAVGPAGAPAPIAELLDEAAAAPAGSDGVIFLPYLVGRGSPRPDPDAAAAFLGLRPRHGRGHLTRAVLEGVAFGLKEIEEEIDGHGIQLRRLRITGGGAESRLWRDIVSDVLDLPGGFTTGGSNLGSAVVLALGLGLFNDLGDAVAELVPEPAEEPSRPRDVAAYERAYSAYRTMTDRTGERP